MATIVHVPKFRRDLTDLDIMIMREEAINAGDLDFDWDLAEMPPEDILRVPVDAEIAGDDDLRRIKAALDRGEPQDWDIALAEAEDQGRNLSVAVKEDAVSTFGAATGAAFLTYASVDILTKERPLDINDNLNAGACLGVAVLCGYLAYRSFCDRLKSMMDLHETKEEIIKLEKDAPIQRQNAYMIVESQLNGPKVQ